MKVMLLSSVGDGQLRGTHGRASPHGVALTPCGPGALSGVAGATPSGSSLLLRSGLSPGLTFLFLGHRDETQPVKELRGAPLTAPPGQHCPLTI